MLEARFHAIIGTGGQVFKVVFKKKDNSLRTMRARLGVKKYVRGALGKGKPKVEGLINCWEKEAGKAEKGYRSFYAENIVSLKAHGNEYDSEGKLKTA